MIFTLLVFASSARNVRPRSGATPRTSKNVVVTLCNMIVSGTGRVSSTSGHGPGNPAVAAMLANA